MKHNTRPLLSSSVASILAISALGQVPSVNQRDLPVANRDRVPQQVRADRLNAAAKASDVIGMTVKNYQDVKLGTVDDLAVDLESGRIVQVILSTGGFLGVGDTLSAVPPGALHLDAAQKILNLNANAEKLKGAPKFEMANWALYSDSNHLTEVYRYYGEEPSLRFIQNGEGIVKQQPAGLGTTERRFLIPSSRLAMAQRASKLMGTPVKNLQDEKLGKVENFLLDLPSTRIVAVIVSSGGFLGIGDELSAVPPMALRFAADREALRLDVSKEALANAPHFKANEWPDFAQPTYASGVYRAYHVEPYFTTNLSTETDHTVRVVERALTPMDQGTSKADISTTAQIRKGILAESGMSVNGKNVKVITLDGQVTLRGPVNTAEEKRQIGEIAINIARLENVDNQLIVQ